MRIQSPNENPVAEEKDDVEGQETDEKYPWPMKKEKRSQKKQKSKESNL